MELTIRQEAGYDLALYGFSLSYKDRAIPPGEWWCLEVLKCEQDFNCVDCKIHERMERITKTALANAGRGKGHDKWLRQVMLWVDIEAPMSWWKHLDTYKVGTVAQSESTMHTLHRRDITPDDCEPTVQEAMIEFFNAFKNGQKRSVDELNDNLPLGYKQRRSVTLNYAVLRCILGQREFHRLGYWREFIDNIYNQVRYPELLPKREGS